ncbi:ABC transporter substrate-binding protein [Paracoccus aestuariivivens]|uniref:ABC transporter substrate-binding protein n=1 Tax=Paracoccus aestuariivivens TaxID=1820333 RepID=A0A6L6JFW9_9RHOB|nr:ABC transporter substrate-binding protein [Paracoccus aestuariivivens]MTH80088.1 ABC transporter substrate-binding protein [Paracoccus aestuariivivens]
MRHMAVAAALMLSTATSALAAEPVKIGVLLTLSGPPAVLGEHARDGVLLAQKALAGKMGDRDIEVVVVDDEGKPDIAAQKARDLVEAQGADFVIGPIFSNIMNAIAAPVTSGGAILVSPNAGPSNFAGKDCNPDIFVASYQNDQMPRVLAQHMNDQGIKTAYVLAPNYQAGKDSLNGFKSLYKSEVAGELYVPLGQLDFSAELAQIAAAQPEAVYAFMPGGMGVNLVKQWDQAGLSSIPLMSAFTVDETTLPAEQDAALGKLTGSNWAPDLDVPGNAEFVAAYKEAYSRVPSLYAMGGYDAVMLIESAVKKAGTEDREALRAALKAADFSSLRGEFSFSSNNFPVQDFYLTKAVKDADGSYRTSVVEKVFTAAADGYVAECPMK